jgi:hypothetical protein
MSTILPPVTAGPMLLKLKAGTGIFFKESEGCGAGVFCAGNVNEINKHSNANETFSNCMFRDLIWLIYRRLILGQPIRPGLLQQSPQGYPSNVYNPGRTGLTAFILNINLQVIREPLGEVQVPEKVLAGQEAVQQNVAHC